MGDPQPSKAPLSGILFAIEELSHVSLTPYHAGDLRHPNRLDCASENVGKHLDGWKPT